MWGTNHSGFGFAELDHVSAQVYRKSVQLGRYVRNEIAQKLGLSEQEAEHAEQTLIHLYLLMPAPGEEDVLAPVSPDAAAAELLSLTPAYFEGRRQRNRTEAFDMVRDIDMIRSLTRTLRNESQTEILTVQPGGARPAEVLNPLRDTLLSALDRGVSMRTLYQHTARQDLFTSSYVRQMSDHGVEVRTTDEVVDRIIIYDREVALIPEQVPKSSPPSAMVVREPNLVQFICRVFEHMWLNAVPFERDSSQPEPVADDVKQAIVRLMAKGYKDEMVARRLGMAVRTCRRHIAEIAEELDATSRFQAGVQAALAGLVHQQTGDKQQGN